jgi:hypothetical protein
MAAESDRSAPNRRVPRPPAGLYKPGRRLWRSVTRDYDLAADELLLLERACRTVDDLDTLDAILAEAPVEVVGGNGQVSLHPGWAERRAYAALLARLLRQLAVPHDDAPGAGLPGPAPKPAHQRRHRGHVAKDPGRVLSLDDRRAARARWEGA